MKHRSILIMAAGTGGHIFPALAVAQELRRQHWDVQWLGTPSGMENDILAESDITLHRLPVNGLRGKGVLALIKAPIMLLRSVMQAYRLLRKQRPCCVLGMGGYVAGPGGVAAKLTGIPLLIHEQNAIAGTTNRLLASVANRVMESFPGTFATKRAAVTTGNPVRRDIADMVPTGRGYDGSRPLRVLVLGGSLGAAALNRIMIELMQDSALRECLEVRHQTGKAKFEDTAASALSAGLTDQAKYSLMPFINDMQEAYQWADLVICRAGAGTLAEIAVAGLPSILIPYPYAIDDHQLANGQHFVNAGAALMFREQNLVIAELAALLKGLVADSARLAGMAVAARRLASPDAAAKVGAICEEICHE